MPRKPKSQKKHIRNPVATRVKLLQATIELVSEKGAAALSLKEAAIRAKVSRGVAYMHFDDRAQLLREAKQWIAEELHNSVMHFSEDESRHDRTFHTTKLVLKHPEAARVMITEAMSGNDLNRGHPLYKLVVNLLKQHKASGRARPDIDVEIMTYIMFGSIAATIMLGAQCKGDDIDSLAERFTDEWDRMMEHGIFQDAPKPRGSDARNRRPQRNARVANRL
jgi:AcrR family transcriptional regulator